MIENLLARWIWIYFGFDPSVVCRLGSGSSPKNWGCMEAHQWLPLQFSRCLFFASNSVNSKSLDLPFLLFSIYWFYCIVVLASDAPRGSWSTEFIMPQKLQVCSAFTAVEGPRRSAVWTCRVSWRMPGHLFRIGEKHRKTELDENNH